MEKPPVFTLLTEVLAWTLDRTASFPKSHRFTFGQRLDGFTLDALERCIEAIYSSAPAKKAPLTALNLLLEKMRVLWRITHGKGWLSQQQLFFVIGKIDEIGRMVGGWLATIEKRR
jgi:hypothetical protein